MQHCQFILLRAGNYIPWLSVVWLSDLCIFWLMWFKMQKNNLLTFSIITITHLDFDAALMDVCALSRVLHRLKTETWTWAIPKSLRPDQNDNDCTAKRPKAILLLHFIHYWQLARQANAANWIHSALFPSYQWALHIYLQHMGHMRADY